MSTLSSSSTLTEIQAAYMDNASYAEDASTAKARAFVTACRLLLLKLPKRSVSGGRGGTEIEIDPRVIQQELTAANQWLAHSRTSQTGGGITYADFDDYRDV